MKEDREIRGQVCWAATLSYALFWRGANCSHHRVTTKLPILEVTNYELRFATSLSSSSTPISVAANARGWQCASGTERMSIVIQEARQLRMQKSETKLARPWAVSSFGSPTLQRDLAILWNNDLPSQSLPFELLNGVGVVANSAGR